jgi:vitamin B12 transporter
MKTFSERYFFVASYTVLWFLLFDSSMLQAQAVSDTVRIPTIEIKAAKIRQQAIGGISQNWTENQLGQLPANNLAELLAAETGSFIKSYGLGSLATSSVRGGSAGHTLVLWNGLPIQSPMLGQLDLSLLPVQAMESIQFTKGGNTALWGSGAVGGVLDLRNQVDFSQGLQAQSQTQVGSFSQFQQQFKMTLGSPTFQSISRLSHQQAGNHFLYRPAPGVAERQQTNARLSQQLLLQDLYWKLNDQQQLAIHFWQQQSDRQIPPTNVQNTSQAHQDDQSTRLILDYQKVTRKGMWQVKTGFFNEHLNFFDDQILLASRSRFRTYLGELTAQWSLGNRQSLLIGNTHTYTRAWSAGYREDIPSEHRSALFASWKYSSPKWQSQLSLRQESVDGSFVPPAPSLGIDFYLTPSFSIKTKLSRNYRLPTLNDRFWQPGGNPDLLPESGWSQELSLEKTVDKQGFQLTASLTVFNRNIENWILWSIREGQNFWSSNNITQVWSRGIEPRLSVSKQFQNLSIQLKSGYDYIRSTNQVPLDNPRIAEGEQLIYTPEHQAFGTLSVQWKGWYGAYQHTYTGATQGINDSLEAYHLGNVRLQYSAKLQKYHLKFFFNLNNIWNRDYLVVERRPMPGIHFQSGIQFIFHKQPTL